MDGGGNAGVYGIILKDKTHLNDVIALLDSVIKQLNLNYKNFLAAHPE